MKLRYTFFVGINAGNRRTVTVVAHSYPDADGKARDELDRRADRQQQEAPVAWDLELKQAVPA